MEVRMGTQDAKDGKSHGDGILLLIKHISFKKKKKYEEHWETEEPTVRLFPGYKLMESFILQL